MSYAYIRPLNPPGPMFFAEVIAIGPIEGVPPRPTPGPTPPGGPVDPGYSPPWAQLPVDPGYGVDIGTGPVRPTHPIALPGDPWWPKPPMPGEPPSGKVVVVRPVPADVTAPSAPSSSATVVQIIMERGSPPTFAFIEPYASTGPVTPPA